MKRFARWTTLAGALGFLALTGAAGAEEEKIPVRKLPRAVIKAARAKFPRARIEAASKEEEDGETTYEVELEDRGRSIDVAMKADGTILEIEKEVAFDTLPKAVKQALTAKYPKAKIEKVEEVTKGKGEPVRYEIAMITEVVFSAKGKVIEADEEEEDDEKPSAKAKKSKKGEDDDEMDEDDDDHKKSSAKAKKSKKGEDDDDEMDDDDDEGKKASAKAKAKKSKKGEDDDDEMDDDDDHKKASAKAKKSKKGEDEDDDDDDDEKPGKGDKD